MNAVRYKGRSLGGITDIILVSSLLVYLNATLNIETCISRPCSCCKEATCVVNKVNNNACDECLSGYTGSMCNARCPINCYNCSQKYFNYDGKCDVCHDGYYNGKYRDIERFLERHDCSLSCDEGCTSYTGFKYCNRCKSGYNMTTQHQCMKCPEYCEICSSPQNCDKCFNGYFLNGSSCQACGVNCKTCFSSNECVLCDSGFYLKGHKCEICPSSCLICNDSHICLACETGHYLRKGLCEMCDDNCLDCRFIEKIEYKCHLCKYGYNLVNGTCAKCGNFCLDCLSNKSCQTCKAGYGLVNGQCYKCKPFCESCYTFESCTVCRDGYINIDGSCKICSDNCLNCNLSVPCDTCRDGYYGQNCAFACSKNCETCEKVNGKCIVCETGTYFNVSGKCMKCPEHCTACQSESKCSLCEDGFIGYTCRCPLNCECSGGDGDCVSCKRGYTGEACRQHCSEGCNEKTCFKKTGECTKGCLPGYTGNKCIKGLGSTERNRADQLPTQSAVVIVGIVLGSAIVFFGIVIASAVGVYLYKRKENTNINTNNKMPEMGRRKMKGKHYEHENVLVEIDDKMETSLTNSAACCGHSNTMFPENTSVKLQEFEDYVRKRTLADSTKEFQELPRSSTRSYKASQKSTNQRKSRFKGIYPFDDNRVVLKTGDANYINASFIDGYKMPRAYIASIGPTKYYMDDMSAFWRMVWQENCGKIVMLCNFSEPKVNTCDQYWPDKDYFLTYGEFTVSALTEEEFVNYTVRHFEVQLGHERRVVRHFHFTTWAEYSDPADVSSLVTFLHEVNNSESDMNGPVVVHCSSGVGRSGTYIALDILSREGEAECHVDVFSCVTKLREQRARMVQTAEQYEFLHRALVHSLNYYAQISGDSPTSAEDATGENDYSDINTYMSLTDAESPLSLLPQTG